MTSLKTYAIAVTSFLAIVCIPCLACADVVVLRDGTKLQGVVANRDVIAKNPHSKNRIAILLEENEELRRIPVPDILYVLLIDGEAKRVVEFPVGPMGVAELEPHPSDPQTITQKRSEIVKIAVGLSFPSRPDLFDEGWKTGFSGCIRVGSIFQRGFSANVGIEYNRFAIDEEYLTGGTPGVKIEGGNLSVFYLSGGLQLQAFNEEEGGEGPYVVVGGGYYRLDVATVEVYGLYETGGVAGDWENAFGLHIGAGVGLSRVFFEGMYVHGFTDVENMGHIAIRAGIAL